MDETVAQSQTGKMQDQAYIELTFQCSIGKTLTEKAAPFERLKFLVILFKKVRLLSSQTRSQASGGIQWRSLPSHLMLQPRGLVKGWEIFFPATSSSNAFSR